MTSTGTLNNLRSGTDLNKGEILRFAQNDKHGSGTDLNKREILRFAQNDKQGAFLNKFSARFATKASATHRGMLHPDRVGVQHDTLCGGVRKSSKR